MRIIDSYMPNAWKTAGDSGARNEAMQPPFNSGLLHLINYLMHTPEGRTFMHDLRPGKLGQTTESIQAPLFAKFAKYNVKGAAAEALLGAHIAGFAWVDAFEAQDEPKQAQQETIFNQHVAAISWFLWEESSGPLFSLGW